MVNLAARLEAYTKVVGELILIDETTKSGLIDEIKTVDQDQFQHKGKTHSVQIYSIPVGQEFEGV